MSKCQNLANFRYTWPGKDEATICIEHACSLMNIATAMGVHLQLIGISYRSSDPFPTEWPRCQQEGAALSAQEE